MRMELPIHAAFLLWAFALTATALPAAGQETASGDTARPAYDRAGWPETLVIAYPATGTPEYTLARYAELDAFLSSYLSLEVKPLVTDGYEPIYVGFKQNKMDLSYLGPLSYVELLEYAPAVPVAMELSGGRPGYHAIIIAAKSSGMKTLEDARGKSLAMTNRHSTSGFLIPSYHFIKNMGITPSAFASRVEFTGSHDELIKAVAKGEFDAGATNDIDLDRACAEQELDPEEFLVLWKSGLYPASPFAARKGLPDTLIKALTDAFIECNLRPEIMEKLGISGFGRVTDAAYDPVRELYSFIK